ncbi:hypothetical protein [Mucilaginibacter celer]|uniref:ScyD/ScyE family protein n=1 Tax=Mucilaginibacter celer TaxID=2305508 RepID=A0A494VW80_9SPHI|nr:hypothetical protein [Mucilaginibacter celer]AYL95242.1 hypothetical protein HYN43_008020 [Mucilaginibacter celer]
MKTNLFTFLCLSLWLTCLVSCKKEKFPVPVVDNEGAVKSDISKITIPDYTILTIAGGPAGFKNGVGKEAAFNSAQGICLKKSGLLYVADYLNNAIRKVEVKALNGVKEQYTATVSTLNTPAGPNGLKLTFPIHAGVSNDGTINVEFMPNPNFAGAVLGRIYKPDGSIYTVQISRGGMTGMSGDPSGDFFWFCSLQGVGKFWSDHIQLPNIQLPADSLKQYYGNHYLYNTASPTIIYAAPNGNKYMASYSQLYKLTQSGVFTKIKPIAEYPYEPYDGMSDLVSTDDGDTLYFIKNGAILSLKNGKISTLYYPNGTNSADGLPAFINATGLAIDDKQHLLYFTDNYEFSSTIKVLTLPGYKAH